MTLTEKKTRISELDSQISNAQSSLDELREENMILRTEAASEQFNIKIGDVVLFRNNEYKVTRIDPKTWSPNQKPWLAGFKKKKDGTFGLQNCTIFSEWEKVS